MVYTGKVNQLQNIVKQCNGICMPGSINKWDLVGLNMEADATSFTSTPHQSVDVNPNSTIALDGRETSTLFLNTSGQMLNIKMSVSALSKLQSYPVFNMATEQVRDQTGADILMKGVYKIFEDIVRHNNNGKTVVDGAIASTGIVARTSSAYKRKKPQGSPRHRKKRHGSLDLPSSRSNVSKQDMDTVQESAL